MICSPVVQNASDLTILRNFGYVQLVGLLIRVRVSQSDAWSNEYLLAQAAVEQVCALAIYTCVSVIRMGFFFYHIVYSNQIQIVHIFRHLLSRTREQDAHEHSIYTNMSDVYG